MHKGCSLWQPPMTQNRSSIRRWILYLREKVLAFLQQHNQNRTRILRKQIMRSQTHHTVPTIKGLGAFLGMGAIKSNSRRHGIWWINLVRLFSFSLHGKWHSDLAMVSRAPIEETEHLSTDTQVTSQHDSWAGMKTALTWLTEHWGVKDDCRTLGPGLQQHRITTQESSQAGKRGCPWGPPNYTTPLHRCWVYRSLYSVSYCLAVWKGYNTGKRHQWSMRDHHIWPATTALRVEHWSPPSMVLGKGSAATQNNRHPKLGPPGTQKQYGQEWKIEGRLGRKTASSKLMIKKKKKGKKKYTLR